MPVTAGATWACARAPVTRVNAPAKIHFFSNISSSSEGHTRRDLNLTRSGPFCCLHVGDSPKRRSAVVQIRYGVIGMIECIGCRSTHLESNRFGNVERLEQGQRNSLRSRTNNRTDR